MTNEEGAVRFEGGFYGGFDKQVELPPRIFSGTLLTNMTMAQIKDKSIK